MCGRTSLFADPSVVEAQFEAEFDYAYEPRYNVAPGQPLATIRNTSRDTIGRQEWGFIPSWPDDPAEAPRPINARAETVARKPFFSDAFQERRCLVLADGFYEWTGERGRKQPYRFHLADDRPFAMAGIWNRWTGNGETRETVAVVTTEPNDLMAPIHDRMPVVLAPGEYDTWLAGYKNDALAVCDPYDGDDMDAYEVSTAVNDPENDRPAVVEPADSRQGGLGEFAGD
jgi:putative SOS response-associated peptidase YedK